MKTRVHIRHMGQLILLLVLLAGCGSLDSQPLPTVTATLSGPATSSTVACALLTKGDAESILGAPVDELNKNSSVDESGAKDEVTTCSYKVMSPLPLSDPGSRQITLIVVNHPDVQEAVKAFADSQKSAGKNAEVVGNVGERAFWNSSMKQLNVLRGDVWLIINADSAAEKGSIAGAQQVAALVLGRIR